VRLFEIPATAERVYQELIKQQAIGNNKTAGHRMRTYIRNGREENL